MKQDIMAQYQAAFKMMESCIRQCPATLWADPSFKNPYWKIVYHALFYTSFYLSENEASFVSWINHRPGLNRLEQTSNLILSVEDLLSYNQEVAQALEQAVTEAAFPEQSGFPWLNMSRLGLHLYNIRHLQHHTGQLIERLSQQGIKIAWK